MTIFKKSKSNLLNLEVNYQYNNKIFAIRKQKNLKSIFILIKKKEITKINNLLIKTIKENIINLKINLFL